MMDSTVFDITSEMCKSLVREVFMVQSGMLDSACAAILHLTQSSKLTDYMVNRKKRLESQTKKTNTLSLNTHNHLHNRYMV